MSQSNNERQSNNAQRQERLGQLRKALDEVDREVIELAARRQEIVAEIKGVKGEMGHALFDRSRERDVLARAEKNAVECGLPKSVAVGVMQALVESSHLLQQDQPASQPVPEPSRKILIVGGGGQMGRLFSSAFQERGHQVITQERDDGHERLIERVGQADVTLLAVPMHLAVDMARRVAPHVPEQALLCDINSLKRDICQVFSESCEGQALGMHPMFGPTVQSMRRQKVVVCPIKGGDLTEWMTHELGRLGVDLIESTPAHHDKMMAIVQVLVHFHTLVMGGALKRTGVPLEESLRFTSPIYRLELAVVGRLFAQNPELYAEIEMANPYAGEVREKFLNATTELAEMLTRGDRNRFVEEFNQVAGYFAEFSREAMSLSDYLIAKLVERA